MIDDFLKVRKIPAYRTDQFFKAYYQDFISSFDELTTWPKPLRDSLKNELAFSTITPVRQIISSDKSTVKILFTRISDGKNFESVLMRHTDDRNTICVSCMIGCPIGCTFCATGKMGFLGNLTSKEIVDQVLYFARLLKTEKESISNIVFMGMGEPLSNLDAVLEAVSIFNDPKKMGLGTRRITISTSGITPFIQRLMEKGYRGRLALSLHAPNQELREEIMPIAEKFPLSDLIEAMRSFARLTNKRVSYEYILIDQVNDLPRHAHELVKLLGTYLTHVNLIPYNPVKGPDYKRSSPASIKRFSNILTKAGLEHTVRITMGDDIRAACGQLATD